MLVTTICVRATRLFALLVLLLSIPVLAVADEPPTAPAPAPTFFSHFTLHGYLTQAWAEADQHQILGITRSGTADYREAALQLRYVPSDHDTFVVQIAHEREGKYLIKSHDVEFDWGFYQHRFATGTTVKIGRIQLPYGIYNEIRDVGTVLPFYRIPSNYYFDSSFTSETLDGMEVTHQFAPQSPWSVEAAAYYGGWTTKAFVGDAIDTSKIRDAVGVQLWMSTPVTGLRFGTHADRDIVKGGIASPGGELQNTYAASVDGNFGRWITRAEASTIRSASYHSEAWYVEASARVLPKVGITMSTDRRHFSVKSVPPIPDLEGEYGADNGFGVNYYFQPSLVFKAEAHRNRAMFVEDSAVNLLARAPRADYFIASLSYSF